MQTTRDLIERDYPILDHYRNTNIKSFLYKLQNNRDDLLRRVKYEIAGPNCLTQILPIYNIMYEAFEDRYNNASEEEKQCNSLGWYMVMLNRVISLSMMLRIYNPKTDYSHKSGISQEVWANITNLRDKDICNFLTYCNYRIMVFNKYENQIICPVEFYNEAFRKYNMFFIDEKDEDRLEKNWHVLNEYCNDKSNYTKMFN